jgi:GT2 family glycosyltransferase
MIVCIIVNYHAPESTIRTILSIRAQTYSDVFVVVVDNESLDLADSEKFNLAGADLVVPSRENLGFAGGVNLGVDSVSEKGFSHIWLLNNDAIAKKTALENLVEASVKCDAQIVGSEIYYDSEPKRLWLEYAVVRRPWFIVQHIGKGSKKREGLNNPFEVDFVNGCSVLIQRSTFDILTGFDEDLFLYSEDVDFCMRWKNMGGRLAMAPDSIVYHSVSEATGGEFNVVREYYITRNGFLMIKRHGGSPVTKLMAMLTRIPWDFYRFSMTAVRSREIKLTAGWFLRAIYDGVTGRIGPVDLDK